MSFQTLDKELFFALRTKGERRTEKELSVIYSHLCRFENLSNMREQSLRELCSLVRYETHEANEVLFRKDDPCRCWYILMSGSVFIQGTMFLPYACFGKQIPGTKRRISQCLVLEPSTMIAVDYPDMTLHGGLINTRPHTYRHSSSNSAASTLDSVVEVDSSSSESSPIHQPRLLKGSNGQIQMRDDISQSSLDDGDDFEEHDPDEEDSISLQSTSSLIIKDLVIEVLKKDIKDRNLDDLEILFEFTKSLRAFANMTEPIRRALCKVMVFAWVEKANTVVLKHGELLDSWSVIINGHVQVRMEGEEDKVKDLHMGDSFGVMLSEQAQTHKGNMYTMCVDCQFLCIAQQQYYDVLHQGQENILNVKNEAGEVIIVKEKREFDGGAKKGNIVIRGTADSLLRHLLDDNSIDATYTEDFLLTYRAFSNEPRMICSKLLEWFDNPPFRDKVVRVILLWVNNHFNDFERDRRMMNLLEKFEEKLHEHKLQGQTRIFNIACSAKAKPRTVTITRQSSDADLGFEIEGGRDNYPNYICSVREGSVAEAKGVKRGDQLLEVNRQNFEKLSRDKAIAILNKNTELNLTLKTNLFAFKQMLEDLSNPQKKKKGKGDDKITHTLGSRPRGMSVTTMTESDSYDTKHRKAYEQAKPRKLSLLNKISSLPSYLNHFMSSGGDQQISVDDNFLGASGKRYQAPPGSSATIDGPRSFRQTASVSLSNPDLLDPASFELAALAEPPEDVIKVYRADQSHRFVCVGRDTTAGDAVAHACKEFGIVDDVENYALYRVSVQGEKFVKQSKLPDPLANLANIPLGSRYYLKNMMNSEQLLPDENIPELLKEANFSFLDLNCFEVALHLTREDYKMFQRTEPANFIQDLFHIDGDLVQYRKFEDLVNRELFWVVTTICKEPNVIQRSKMIKHFIKIAHHCKIIKNLNSTFALVSGLGYRAVSRMKQAWEKVPAKSARLFDELQALMDPSRNMSKYRTLLNEYTSQPPVVPYIPVVKKDLTFLHLGNDTMVDGLINFEKMRMIGKEVRNICRLCVPDSSQIIPSAEATHQRDADRGGIYTTLTRRGRRSSFNNARRMYEDQVNVRRVKQFMLEMEIVSDEDKLMEMSKAVEAPVAPNSSATKRMNKGSDSPSRIAAASRNNSEPQLATIPTVTVHPSRRKVPVSSLPKFGAQSPQALKKLIALTEEGTDRGGGGERKIRDFKRSESAGSHDASPAASPYMSPKHDRHKKNQSNHTVGMENANKNNNRLSLPAVVTSEPPSPGVLSAPATNKRFFPVVSSNASAPSSSRSSIASTSSLGTYSSSNPVHSSTSSLGGSSSSPRSSPVQWGSVGSVHSTASASPRLIQGQHKTSNSPVRSSSSSSADTVKSAGGKPSVHHERPVIKQTRNVRSGSFGGVMIMPGKTDRRLTHIPTSASTPSLNVGGVSQAPLILPNHPQIPRTPSIDSGVISAGSLSADSVNFNTTDDAEIFRRVHQHHHHQPHISAPHGRHPDHHHPTHAAASSGSQSAGVAASRHQAPGDRARQRPLAASAQHPDPSENGDEDKVEQTFLSGFRGQGDPPRPDNKDPYLADPTSVPPMAIVPGDPIAPYPSHIPPGTAQYGHHHRHHAPHPKVLGGGAFRGIHEYLICERHAAMRRQWRSAMPYSQAVQFVPRSDRMKTPESILEEQLLLELQQQKPAGPKMKRKVSPPNVGDEYTSQSNLVDARRLSLSQSDPSLLKQQQAQWPVQDANYPAAVETARPTVLLPYHTRTSSPKGLILQNYSEPSMAPCSPVVDSVFSQAGVTAAEYRRFSNSYTAPASYSPLVGSTVEDGAPKSFVSNGHSMEPGYEWQYPGQPERLSKSVNLPATPHNLSARLNATMPTSVPVSRTSQSFPANSPITPRNLHLPLPPRQDYIAMQTVPEHAYPDASDVRRARLQSRKKMSEEWSETDLDSEKLHQTMRAWGSSTSLPATPLTSRSVAHDIPSPSTCKPPTPVLSGAPHGFPSPAGPRRPSNKLPPPLPPQRTSSIGRTRQLRIGSGSSSPSSPPLSPTLNSDMNKSFDDALTHPAGRMVLPPSTPITNGHIGQHRASYSSGNQQPSVTSLERRSLPSYTEAVKQINAKQKNIFTPPSMPTNYRSFIDPHENTEQVSQV